MKVCTCCFNDIELKGFISSNSLEKGKCDYCNDGIHSELLEVGELLDFFSTFISVFEPSKDGEPLVDLINKDWDFFSGKIEGHDILSDILLAINSSILSPQETVSYTTDIIECISFWDDLKEKLKWESRFLTNTNEISDLGWDFYFSNNQIKLSPKEVLYV